MAKDKIHDLVKQVLINDGWIITHDPYIIETKDVIFSSSSKDSSRIFFIIFRSKGSKTL